MAIQLPLNNTSALTLSSARISKLLSSNGEQEATKMGLWDKFKDLFRPQSKAAALGQLYRAMEDSGLSGFARFDLLARLALPENKALFTVQIKPHESDPNKHTIQYCIDATPIKSDEINDYEKEVICARMGKAVSTELFDEKITSIDHYKIDTSDAIERLSDGSFSGGGVNKKFNAETGVLRAETPVGVEDFDREHRVTEHQKDYPELGSYVSTQRKIDCPRNLSDKYAYAVVDVFDKTHVESAEMDNCLDSLNRDQAKMLLVQLVDMARVLYKNKVAHRDLHMHNLVVHKLVDTQSVHLKAIDFGRVKMGSSFESRKFEDINYLFSKKGVTALETFGRNVLAPRGSEVDKKHYPIHKLCNKFNERDVDLDPVLAKIGAQLTDELKQAGEDGDAVDLAFQQASLSLQLIFSQLQAQGGAGVSYA